ncbi:hypothetical protein [Nonlabens ponticola]|uniref:Uncharacterized protein n=1 Tax=Nonlabens ponticola TaxID=2496866 RepID=A0A3S9MVP1_9FLAO|nr:hypothetical protein [Nonlabens ponticola]AZQ43295.1 hypothetical protein EJ995_03230 [Nonlabens ponticola]
MAARIICLVLLVAFISSCRSKKEHMVPATNGTAKNVAYKDASADHIHIINANAVINRLRIESQVKLAV